MKKFIGLSLSLILVACAGSYYEAQSREDAKEVTVDGRVIRVFDLGNNKIEMIRKGYVQSGSVAEHWGDFIYAGQKVTGCKIINVMPRPGVENALVWVQATKDCSNK